MSFPRVSMRKLREILRLHFEAGLKHRQIARNCNTSHVTVDKNVDAATQAALSWPLPEDLADDEALYTRLFPTSVAAAEPPRLLPEWADIHDQLSANRKRSPSSGVFPLLRPSVCRYYQELYVNLIRKTVSQSEARQTISDYCAWHAVDNDPTLLVEGIDLQIRWQSSFWDALILSRRRAGAGVIWSEDLDTTQDYGGIVAVNPLI